MQSQHSYNINNDDDVKLLLAQIRKMQDITEVEALTINKTAPLTKVVVGEKRSDISIRKI